MQKKSSAQRVAEAGFTAWNKPDTGVPRPGDRARVFALRARAAFAVAQAGQELAEEFLMSGRQLCACCYCSRPGRMGGCSFA